MQEENRKESEQMATAIEVARLAEALSILRMLIKAIENGDDINGFREYLEAYVDGLQNK